MNAAVNPASTAAWATLSALAADGGTVRMAEAFAADPGRATRFALDAAGLRLDFSKNRIDDQILEQLLELAGQCGVAERRDAMFAGEAINSTEHRAVLHVALRGDGSRRYATAGHEVMPDVLRVREQMRDFARKVRSGEWRGFGGERITDIVNIGIGGSDLGPFMVCEALRSQVPAAAGESSLRAHFVSNVDAAHLDRVLAGLDAGRTLFVVSSKTFTTQETLTNARSARQWFLGQGGSDADVARHFVAVSSNAGEVRKFGIDEGNRFEFWDWVGGRYSLWSAIGLPIALAHGMEAFDELLAGARAMDEHFASAPLDANMPVLLALVGLWNSNFLGAGSVCIAPYAQDLYRLPAYLQQLEMESNGKSVTLAGEPAAVATAPVVWGEPGTNGQHAYFQLLHQGSRLTPVDFIASLRPTGSSVEHHRLLLANCFAQSEALMVGKGEASVRAELEAQGMAPAEIAVLLPHKVFAGNRPSNTILLPELSPRSLGALIALYEHKVFVQGAIWGINSFDQWGVELGKQLARTIEGELRSGETGAGHDASTAALIARTLAARQA